MSVQQSGNQDQRESTYAEVLRSIADGRQATTTATELDPEVIALHDQLQEVDTSQPGWIQRLLDR